MTHSSSFRILTFLVLEQSLSFTAKSTCHRSSSSGSSSSSTGCASSLAALPKDELLRIAREYLDSNPSPDDWWSEDYVFRGGMIGPLCN